MKADKKIHPLSTLDFTWKACRTNLLFFLIGIISSTFLYSYISQNTNENSTKPLAINSPHKLAIIVPFRDRFDELLLFVPHISKFLATQSIKHYQIFVINQADTYRFNRASLINVGFLEAMSKKYDYMIMHDVDLLPMNPRINYSYPNEGVNHLSCSGLHPNYDYKTFLGGIVAINKHDFMLVNGMSNRYWGWGREDDDFFIRLKKAKLQINRPRVEEFQTGKKFTFLEIHNSERRVRDKKTFFKQKEESLRLERSGLNNVRYVVKRRWEVTVDGYGCSVIDVQLFCDRSDTHWCNFNYQFDD